MPAQKKSPKSPAEPAPVEEIVPGQVLTIPAREEQSLSVSSTPEGLLQLGINKGLPIESLEKLMSLYERWKEQQSREQFYLAFSNFQSSVPKLEKKKVVNYTSKNGGVTNYRYAPLSEIAETVKESLRLNGLSYRWEFSDVDASTLKCTCFVTHSSGHNATSSMTAQKDSSGNKNDIQSRGSTMTYLQRYTLIAALGLTTADEDNDAQGDESTPDQSSSAAPSGSTTFDPTKEHITFGKYSPEKNDGIITVWAELPVDYLQWLKENGKPDSKAKATASLQHIEMMNKATPDPLDAVFGPANTTPPAAEPKKPEQPSPEEQIAAQMEAIYHRGLNAIKTALTVERIEAIKTSCRVDYLDKGLLTQELCDELIEAANERSEKIGKKGTAK